MVNCSTQQIVKCRLESYHSVDHRVSPKIFVENIFRGRRRWKAHFSIFKMKSDIFWKYDPTEIFTVIAAFQKSIFQTLLPHTQVQIDKVTPP